MQIGKVLAVSRDFHAVTCFEIGDELLFRMRHRYSLVDDLSQFFFPTRFAFHNDVFLFRRSPVLRLLLPIEFAETVFSPYAVRLVFHLCVFVGIDMQFLSANRIYGVDDDVAVYRWVSV